MSIYTFKKRWAGGGRLKKNGKTVREIWKNGQRIYTGWDKPADLTEGATVLEISGANNAVWQCDQSGFYRFYCASSAGGNSTKAQGGAGAVIQYDLWLEQGDLIYAWAGSGATSGALAESNLKGGTGQANYTGNLPSDYNFWLGGGGRNGYSANDSGSGGGGAAGNGGHGNNASGYGVDGGAGAGIIVYKDRGTEVSKDTFVEHGLYAVLCAGGGGAGCDNGTPRRGGASGGAGSAGGANSQGAGGTNEGFFTADGLVAGTNADMSGKYGITGKPAIGNLIENVGDGTFKVLTNQTGSNSSTTGRCFIKRLL